MKKSIKRRILFYFLIIAVTAIISVSFLAVIQTEKVLTEKTTSHFEKISEELYYNVNKIIAKGLSEITIISNSNIVASEYAGPARKRAELLKLKKILKVYEDITLVNLKGVVITSTDYNFRGGWEYKKHFIKASRGKTSISNVHLIPDPDKLIISFTAPVYNRNNTIQAIVSIQLNMNTVADIVNHVQIEQTGYAYLLDEYNKIIAHPNSAKVLTAANEELIFGIEKGNNAIRYREEDGKEILGSFFNRDKVTIDPGLDRWYTDWKVVVVQEKNELFQILTDIKIRIFIFSSVLFGIIILLGMRLSGSITSPIEHLRQGASIIGKGDLDYRVEVESEDEVGQLARSFNHMAEDLRLSHIAISKSERRLRTILETANEGFWEIDNDFFIRDINPEVCAMLGYSRDEMIGKNTFDFLYDSDAASIFKQQLKLRDKGVKSSYELNLKRSDNTPVYCLINATPLFNEEGKKNGSFGMLSNITSRMQAEEKIIVQNEELADINDELERINEELIGKHRENHRIRKEIETLNEKLEQRVEERTIELKLANASIKESFDTLKSTKDQLVESEKMASLGGLVAGVAHEINTPIGVGVTAASYLEAKIRNIADLYSAGTIPTEELEKFIGNAVEASSAISINLRRAAELIQSFKQVAVDQSSEKERTFNLKKYIEEVLISLGPRLKDSSHVIKVESPNTIEICSYPGVFSQIITNLVINSLVHGFEGIETGEIRIEIARHNHDLQISYRDNGIGMDEKTLKNIFVPFYTTKRGKGGSGLGMHIVFNLVNQRIGGTIQCSSFPGKGTTFVIRIPGEKILLKD
ncbi:MAG: PAS domain S-box protein [bacterium]|nr:PAS domain S-box protein [bacterium]